MPYNLPNDFMSWKSFQSLTQTAAIAWIITLIIDVIFLQRIEDHQTQLFWVWSIGFVICFGLACIRLYYKEVRERGDKFMVIFNSALIFLYASGFNGATKELGSWSQYNKTEDKQGSSLIKHPKPLYNLASFIPNVFADQTAFWPDIKMINENQDLKQENESLQKKVQELQMGVSPALPVDTAGIQAAIDKLQKENDRLYSLLADCKGYNCDEYVKMIKELKAENQLLQDSLNNMSRANCDDLKKMNGDLMRERDRLQQELSTLRDRVIAFNNLIRQYKSIVGGSKNIVDQENRFYSLLMNQDYKNYGGDQYVTVVRSILGNEINVK
jgi:hypothetical protein